MRARRISIMVVVIAIAAALGLIDSLVGNDLDLAVLFAVVVVLSSVELMRSVVGRHRVPVRADVGSWLSATSSTTGESPTDLASRAISAYRAGLIAEAPIGTLGGDTTSEASRR